jgi:hypothetical protein
MPAIGARHRQSLRREYSWQEHPSSCRPFRRGRQHGLAAARPRREGQAIAAAMRRALGRKRLRRPAETFSREAFMARWRRLLDAGDAAAAA